MEKKTKLTLINIAIAVVSVASVILLSMIFTDRSSDWYVNLFKPSQYPPAYLFPIMWSIIYVLLAVSIFVLLQEYKMNKTYVWLYSLNGLFNILWCLVFFTLQSTIGGLTVIMLNAVVAVLLIIKLFASKTWLGLTCSIYPLWVILATFLNASVWILN